MNYQESREYIDKITREIPSVLGLEHMRELMKRLGNPQDDLKYVHVAGTNGKGSVIAFFVFCFIRCEISHWKICFAYPVFLQRQDGSFGKQDQQRGLCCLYYTGV
mgnify:CR=1 FL=1